MKFGTTAECVAAALSFFGVAPVTSRALPLGAYRASAGVESVAGEYVGYHCTRSLRRDQIKVLFVEQAGELTGEGMDGYGRSIATGRQAGEFVAWRIRYLDGIGAYENEGRAFEGVVDGPVIVGMSNLFGASPGFFILVRRESFRKTRGQARSVVTALSWAALVLIGTFFVVADDTGIPLPFRSILAIVVAMLTLSGLVALWLLRTHASRAIASFSKSWKNLRGPLAIRIAEQGPFQPAIITPEARARIGVEPDEDEGSPPPRERSTR